MYLEYNLEHSFSKYGPWARAAPKYRLEMKIGGPKSRLTMVNGMLSHNQHVYSLIHGSCQYIAYKWKFSDVSKVYGLLRLFWIIQWAQYNHTESLKIENCFWLESERETKKESKRDSKYERDGLGGGARMENMRKNLGSL